MSEGKGAGELVLSIGLVAITGFTLPLERGWAPPLAAAALAIVGLAFAPRLVPDPPSAPAPPWARVAVVVPLVLATAVVLTVNAKILAAILMAFPAACWGVAALVPVLVGAKFRGPGRIVLASVCALLVPVLGVIGTRFEAGGIDARGQAFSGPIHGIHPFQVTAIVIDGHGPFDLPFNDYVEPDGNRGYGPEAYAEAMALALDRIAELHFAHGPERARLAFERAEVGVVRDPPIAERLDRAPPEGIQPRLFVRSGSHGQRSSVEFVCPGRTFDPKPYGREDPSDDMCPSKYASEASAGLGVTGRWPGYAESRGNERLGLSRWFGSTRSDDAVGQAWSRRERQWLAWIAIAGAVLLTIVAPRSRGAVQTLASAVLVVVLAVGIASFLASGPHALQLRAIESPPAPRAWGQVGLPLVAGLAVAVQALAEGRAPGRRHAIAGLALTGIVTFAVASVLPVLPWISPDHVGAPLPWQRFIEGAADTMPAFGAGGAGIDVFDREGAIAAIAVVMLLGLAVTCLEGLGRALAWIRGPVTASTNAWSGLFVLVLVGAIACALTVSQKTEGASLLLPGAIGLWLVSATGRALLVHGWGRAHGWAFAHVGAVLVAAGLVLSAEIAATEPWHPFVLVCTTAGGVALALGLAVLAVRQPGRRA